MKYILAMALFCYNANATDQNRMTAAGSSKKAMIDLEKKPIEALDLKMYYNNESKKLEYYLQNRDYFQNYKKYVDESNKADMPKNASIDGGDEQRRIPNINGPGITPNEVMSAGFDLAKSTVCSSKIKPKTATLNIPPFTFTWETSELCK